MRIPRHFLPRAFAFALVSGTLAFAFALTPFGTRYAEYRESVRTVSPTRPDVRANLPDKAGAALSGTGAETEISEDFLAGPGPEPKARFLGLVDSAEREIVFTVYVLSDTDVVSALSEAAKRGVSVRGIVERDVYGIPNANRKSRDRLLAAGADVRAPKDDPFAYFHAKYLVADGRSYSFSTANYAKTSFSKNREFFVFGNDPEMAGFLRSVFEADFAGIPYRGPVPNRAYLADSDAREKLRGFLSDATERLEILAPSLSDAETLRILREKIRGGIRVSVCLREKSDVPEIRSELGNAAAVTTSS